MAIFFKCCIVCRLLLLLFLFLQAKVARVSTKWNVLQKKAPESGGGGTSLSAGKKGGVVWGVLGPGWSGKQKQSKVYGSSFLLYKSGCLLLVRCRIVEVCGIDFGTS